jgi:RNA polymerase sigma factor (sigma-70 family)
MNLEQVYIQYRTQLFGLSYRMLGTAYDAEDIVQNIFISLSKVDMNHIENMKAYLFRMATNRCLNQLKSARRKREVYVGEWLPEPLSDHRENEPASLAIQHENISYALLVMIHRLSPVERAVYILKEILGFSYMDIAGILAKTEINCRKIYSRAVMKLQPSSPPLLERQQEKAELFINSFIQATQTGAFQPLVTFLLEEILLTADGGGKVRSAINTIVGVKHVIAYLEGVNAKGVFAGELALVGMNGEIGMKMMKAGRTVKILYFEWDPRGSHIQHIYMVVNPDKLGSFNETD